MQTRMAVVQCKIGARMVEQRITPGAGNMTGLALTTVATGVIVFAEMATDTFIRESILKVFPGMAILAIQAAMPVFERETGFQQMVEADALPRRCRVTIVAGRTIPSAVNIVHCMATDTLCWRAIKHIAAMAIYTFNRGVFTR